MTTNKTAAPWELPNNHPVNQQLDIMVLKEAIASQGRMIERLVQEKRDDHNK